MIVTLSSIALPGTNGFVGEFLILLGAFRANMVYGILATTGVVLGAVYMLWMFQRVMFGEMTKEENRKLKDLGKRESADPLLAWSSLSCSWASIRRCSSRRWIRPSQSTLLS